MTKQEFFALVKRHNAGNADATRELRTFADDPRMRREAVKRASRKTRSRRSKPTSTAGRISRSVLRDVTELLGITRPLTIRWVTADVIPGRNGEHEFTGQGEHLILLRAGRSAEDTNRTLLHELAHAATSEGFGSRWRWKRAYDADPERFEAEADELASVLGHLKLVK